MSPSALRQSVAVLSAVLAGLGCSEAGTTEAGSRDAAPDGSRVELAFPGAEGFGREARGGRGGDVCHVTTLEDSGSGSLRDCVSQPMRTVVFDVSGWIALTGDLWLAANQLTIAGQTAPGEGIGVRGHKLLITGQDIVLRFLRVRRGIGSTTQRDDAVGIAPTANRVIVDHCSIAFGTDETLSMPGDSETGPQNLTVQWTIVAWGLQRDNHSAGSLLSASRTSIHHTLWALNKTRNPRARSAQVFPDGGGGELDWVNNLIYGWDARDPVGEQNGWTLNHHPFILGGTTNGRHLANAIGNYFVSQGPSSAAFVDGTSNFELFAEDNLLDGNGNGVLDVSASGNDVISGAPTLLAARLPTPEIAIDPADAVHERVLAGAGAMVPARDEVDALLVDRVRTQTGLLIQSELDLAALGVGEQGYGTLPPVAREPSFDTDQDGMPDAWENEQGLDPHAPADRNDDPDGDGYTHLEHYLNSLVPEAAWGR